ncbi:MAG: hypothetical protein WD847_08900 [Pirellulales bacterium]
MDRGRGSGTSGKLTAGDTFGQGTYVRWTTHQYTECCKQASTRLYHLIPGSGAGTEGNQYSQTNFGYDIRNRRNRVVSPGGTITKQIFEARGLPTQILVGTSDANLVAVAEYEYDSGADGGDGNLTKETQHVDGNSANDRVTVHAHDWRNRRTSTDGEIDFYQKSYFDNFGRVVKSERYDTTSSGNLLARSETKYDDRGRVFRTVRYAVDPATGSVGNSLTDDTWYDAGGNVIKHFPAGSKAFSKSVFDGLGRETKQYVGYDTAESSYSDAGNVTGDTLFEQVETAYDAASNVIQTTARRRFHNATGTGELTTPSGSQPKARVSYAALYPDAVGRQQALADYGTNGGSAFTRASTVPARSDTVLVTSTEYNSDGEGFKTIDPMATQTRQEFDAAGRQTKLIENYIDGDPSTGAADEDRTTVTAYNADGQVKTLTAKNPTTGDQVTKYVYGSTLAESGVASSQLLRAVIYPDSDDEDSPLGNGADGIYDRVEYKYNRQGERVELKDQRETVHVYDHDKLGRLIHDRVTELGSPFGTPVFSSSSSGSSSSSSSSVPGASSSSSSSGPGDVVDGSVRRISRTYEVRGMVEHVSSHDNATVGAGNVVNDVQFVYNTFGQLVTEYQEHDGAVSVSTTPKVQYAYADGSANHVRRTSMTYPNGRILRYEYSSGADDNLGRVSFLADDAAGAVGTHLAEYTYLGLGSIVQVDYTEPDIRYDLISGTGDDPYDGLDRFDRVVDCLWRDYGTSTDVERVKHGYDRASNRLWRENTVAPAGFDELYSYDGLYQLKDFERGDLNAGKTAITGLAFAQEWSLDATGNWSAFKEDADGNGSWDLNQSRSHNKVNEISTIGASAGADWADPVHDRVGNMVLIPQPADPTQSYTATWDAWNRLMKLVDGMATVGQYAYDGGARRTEKLV